jgi:hypothetical protein
MNDLIAQLARARDIEQEYRTEIAELEQEIAATKLGQRLAYVKSDLLPTAKADVEDATAAVRRAGVEVFEETGMTRPHPAVQIKRYKVLDYDADEALNYARFYLPQALKLDRRIFEKIAVTLIEEFAKAELDFVAISKEPRATIARDLSEYVTKDKTAISDPS